MQAIAKSIRFDLCSLWIIVHDTQSKPFVPVFHNELKILEIPCSAPKSISGNGPRNVGLSLVSEGHVYFLDDDNLVHPSFWTEIVPFCEPKTIFTFDMEYGDGRVLHGSEAKRLHIDTAMIVFDSELVGHLQWELMEYTADGIFIETLVERNHKYWAYCPVTAAYYNRLSV